MEGLHASDSGATPPQIWQEEAEKLHKVIGEGLSGNIRNIAIVSEYLAGRKDLVSEVGRTYPGRVKRITLTETLHDLSILSQHDDADIIIVENCRFIFQRTINGFHLLDEFIEILSRKEKIWITTWNIHTWNYLTAVKDIGSLFGAQIELRQKGAPDIKRIILSRKPGSFSYTIDVPVPHRMVLVHRQKTCTIPIIHKTITFPYYTLRFRLLSALLVNKSKGLEPSELIFERLYQISNGNPGIALQIWQQVGDASEIRLSSLVPPSVSGISDPDTAYVLLLIMTYEDVLMSDLEQELPSEINLSLISSKLRDKELVISKEGRVQIKPIALAGITQELKRIRMVW